MKKISIICWVLAVAIIISSCSKDDAPAPAAPKVTTGVYVLNEGLFNRNNSTLTYYQFSNSTASTDFYTTSNGSGLGDSGNDMLIYGTKIYIVVNGSSYLEIADALTTKSIKKIDFKTTGGAKRQPRYALAYKNKVLVSSYDGTVAVVDTTSLSIEKYITVGANPEQMAISGDKLYVANSGGISSTGYDSTLSVVDLNTYTETRKITVGLNPGSVAADNAGNVYVGCTGDYGAVHAKLVKVSTTTSTVIKSADTAVGKIRFYDGQLYATGGYLGVAKVRTLSTTDFAQTRSNFVIDGTAIKTPYGLNIDDATGDVYVTDAKDYISSGEVFCFDKTGKKKFSFSVSPGINPNTVVLVKK